MLARFTLRTASFGVALLSFAAARSQTAHAQSSTRCARTDGSVENWHEQRSGEDVRWRAHWSGDDCSIDLRATGDVRFNRDFTDIASLGGGSLEITEVQGETTRRMTMRSDNGRLVRSWTVNSRAQPWDDDAQRWLADLLIELDRVTAVGVDYRFPTLLAKGPGAVIDEAQKMHGDYARSVYLRRLVDSVPLSDANYQRVVVIAGHDMHSDYERSRILRAIADHTTFASTSMRAAYLDVVGDMSSDYERSRVLQEIVTRTPLSRDVGQGAIRAAGSFSSDYERSRVLLAAIDNKALQLDDAIPILETVTKSNSDYEKSRVLLAVAHRWTLTGESRKAYLRAADTIHSDYENRRVLSALVTQEARR